MKFNQRLLSAFLLLFIAAEFLFAEEDSFNTTWSGKIKVPFNQELVILSKTDNVIITKSCELMSNMMFGNNLLPARSRLFRCDLKANTVLDKTISINTDNQSRSMLSVLFYNNQIHVLSYFVNKEQNKVFFFSETVNDSTLEVRNDVKMFFELDYAQYNNFKIGTLLTSVKYEDNRLILQNSFTANDKYNFLINTFDENEKAIAKFLYNPDNDHRQIVKYVLDKNDNLYAMDFTSVKNTPGYYRICFLSKEKKEMKTSEIVDIRFDGQPEIKVSPENKLVCAGMYYEQNNTLPAGIISIVYPPFLNGNETINQKQLTKEFFLNGIEGLNKKIEKEHTDCEANNNMVYEINNLHFNPDGSFYLVGERTVLFVTTYQGDRNYSKEFGDITSVRFSKTGEVQWMNNLPRRVQLSGKGIFTGSVKTFYDSNNNLALAYSLIPDDHINKTKKAATCISTFDANGNKTDHNIETNSKMVEKFMPCYSVIVNTNELLGVYLTSKLISPVYMIGHYKLDSIIK